MSEKQKKSNPGRTRNYVTVVYPESAPNNWKEILADECVPAFISPLHDSDYNADGEVKKAHYHVMVMFDGVKSESQAKELFDKIGGVGLQKVNSTRGYARYLCHLDNPEKAQYNQSDIIQLGGADYISVIGLTSDKYQAVREIIEFCKQNEIICYADLLEYSALNNESWFRVLCDNGTVVVSQYLKSAAWRLTQK